jgi:hypothetical protein
MPAHLDEAVLVSKALLKPNLQAMSAGGTFLDGFFHGFLRSSGVALRIQRFPFSIAPEAR